jgi:hypothetical protein
MLRVSTLAAIAVLLAGPSHGACTRPDKPSCATAKTPFSGQADYDACRVEMIAYKGGMENLAQCLRSDGQSAADQRAVLAEMENALAQFNRRARGEL